MEEMLAALDHLVTQGKVRYIGASSMYAWQFQRLLSISEQRGWARFATMQNHYNLVYREEEREMIPLCQDQGIGIIPWSPLARGMLAGTRKALGDSSTSRSSTDELDQKLYDQPSDWEVVEAVKHIAQQRGEPPARIALAWLLAKPAVTAPIVGATKIRHLDDAIAAVDIELTEEEIAALEAPYRAHPVKGMEAPRT
jgi:aryl-alcohol dehydrogenase-like predicted oxidoreductase